MTTTVGVNSTVVERVEPGQMPGYSYHYPHLKRVQLAAVKEGMFHPNLPTFRRMDMDTARHLLPDEHSRTTTTCGPVDFSRAKTTGFAPAPQKLSSLNITDQGRAHHKLYSSPDDFKKARQEFSEFLNSSPGKPEVKLPELPNKKDLHFTGYAVRYTKPDITGSWKYTLRQEPNMDQYGQRPIPANIYARYRDSYPQYFRNVSAEAWR
ncbi:sperm microtubule inner protein 8-like [Babylonia areolata]|uniref:sperm microtubule inner protein 8-like n=1 Tax=Babylonia areolata TaxID=304850 RepID=UPI003FD31D41